MHPAVVIQIAKQWISNSLGYRLEICCCFGFIYRLLDYFELTWWESKLLTEWHYVSGIIWWSEPLVLIETASRCPSFVIFFWAARFHWVNCCTEVLAEKPLSLLIPLKNYFLMSEVHDVFNIFATNGILYNTECFQLFDVV